MMRGVIIGALSVTGLALAGIGPLGAQEVIKDADAVRACLCQEQTLATLLDSLHERQQNYENSQKALADLNSALDAQKAKMDVYNNADVEAYKALLQKRDDAATAFANDATPSYNAAIQRYNAARDGYQGSCAGKSYDPIVYNAVKPTLACAKP
jgi:peptidoglycan hydrolase CwlO-like protein